MRGFGIHVMSVWHYRLKCPFCQQRASRSQVLDAQLDAKSAAPPVLACESCGERLTPDFQPRWLRVTVILLPFCLALIAVLGRPRLLVPALVAVGSWIVFVGWSMPYVTTLAPAKR